MLETIKSARQFQIVAKVLKATAGQYDNFIAPEQELLDGLFSLKKEDFLLI